LGALLEILLIIANVGSAVVLFPVLKRQNEGLALAIGIGIGGPLIIVSGPAVLFNVIEPGLAPQVIATIPEFAWELSLGIYLMVKGFKPSPILSAATGDAGPAGSAGSADHSPALAASDG
jgi:hypothetical protein